MPSELRGPKKKTRFKNQEFDRFTHRNFEKTPQSRLLVLDIEKGRSPKTQIDCQDNAVCKPCLCHFPIQSTCCVSGLALSFQ